VAGASLTVRAPGRVNLIGEHTDYNDGYVMPIAIDRYTEVRAIARGDDRVELQSEGFGAAAGFSLAELRAGERAGAATGPTPGAAAVGTWSRYVRAVVWALLEAGHRLRGANLEIRSTVPAGSGLSSSAALEVACGYALLRLAGIEPDRTGLARLCQRAENEYVGARCGIMDQYIACHGQAGHALLLDCRTLGHRQLPLHFAGADTRFVVCNSMVRHAVAGGEYNRRRAQCEAAVRCMAGRRPAIRALRDVRSADLAGLAQGMDEAILRRCQHVIGENERVQAAAEAIGRGDAIGFGALMYASHASLRDDFEVSCAELDLLVDLARGLDGVYGARMTGGGFGGCTVNLVRADAVGHFEQAVTAAFRAATGQRPQIFVCRASGGVAGVGGSQAAGPGGST
jgi:galactokinase